jgi:SNF2 family DNA or RNA helicase
MPQTHGHVTYVVDPPEPATLHNRRRIPRGGQWRVVGEPHIIMRMKRVFPRVLASAAGGILLSDTPEVCRDLQWVLERWPLHLDQQTRVRLAAGADQHRATETVVEEILAGHREPDRSRIPGRTPRDYQQQAADLILATGRLLCTDEVGLGKTFTSLLTLAAEDALPALVVTLSGTMPAQWLHELQLAWPELLGHIVMTGKVYDPATKRTCRGRQPDVLIMNYHKLDKWADHLSGRVRTVIFDEAQELRHTGTGKYTAAVYVAANAKYRVGATASPIYNYGGEVHSVVDVIAPGALGSREEFLREWGVPTGMNGDHIKVTRPELLHSYLTAEGLMLGRTRVQVGRELPPTQLIEQHVDADPRALDSVSTGAVEMARFILAREGSHTERWRARGELDNQLRQATGIAKAPHVAGFVNMLLESEPRVVLWGWHRSCYDIWLDLLQTHRPVLFTGTETPVEKRESLKLFKSGESRVLVMSLRSGIGIDGLQEVCNVGVFGELDWSPQVHRQCIGRLRRDGQDNPTLAYFLVADEGSDPLVAETLNVKQMQADLIVGHGAGTVTAVADGVDRVGRLAARVLARAGVELPHPVEERQAG